MAKARKDSRGRALRKGEVQRKSDGKYVYTYTDPLGRRKYIYSNDLMTLREKEKQLVRDQLDGLDTYVAGKATINEVFDRYMSIKYDIRETTRSGYIYTYDKYVRDTFGLKKIADIKYSDVYHFYNHLIAERGFSISTVDSVHCLLHPTFQLAVRDEIIRKNPSDGVMREINKRSGKNKGVRHALTIPEQRVFLDYIANHPVYNHWWTLFTVMLGTGMRIGEAIGLRWEDINIEERSISVNHSLVYFVSPETGKSIFKVSKPKTNAGIRQIPMLDVVKDAFELELEEQKEIGFNQSTIDGMTGFIFTNRNGYVHNPQTINQAIKRISGSYNAEELINAKREKREPVILPKFSCHHLRHTFCTRLCENETNLKVIQSVMGHRDIQTTLDIYADVTEEKKQETFILLSQKLDIF